MTDQPRRTGVIQTRSGAVQGVVDPLWGAQVYRGLPYAQAERFAEPRSPEPWIGVRDAAGNGPVAPQNAPEFNLSVLPAMDEACLNLNVFTPAADAARRPVLVYIHAGAFVSGAGSGATQDGARLAAEEDVVVVTINYRLGILGWPPFSARGAGAGRNLGLSDQVAALAWIGDHIAAFGGDPGKVTLFGYSAGGWSIVALLALPAAKGLFHRAVVQSGSEFSATSPGDQDALAARVLALTGAADASELISAPLDRLLAAQQALLEERQNDPARRVDEGVVFGPRIDPASLAEPPMATVLAGREHPLPLLIGSTEDELGWTPFRAGLDWLAALHTRDASLETPTRAFGAARARAIWDAYAAAYPGADDAALAGRIRSDRYYRLPAIHAAEAHAARAPTWMYRFELKAPSEVAGNVSTHATDLAFWLGTMAASPLQRFLFGRAPTVDEEALARRMRADLAMFARTGRCAWPPYRAGERLTRLYDLQDSLAEDPGGGVRDVW
ncbi:carboxylesterase/lipase family protein [Caulobacter sp. KR2-114]|uniref:carboxylesterase/lipase family protein n=1 Tax=Caulobacter sp. KR2-114 TaxID=3400912 RepID=UPI003C061C7C